MTSPYSSLTVQNLLHILEETIHDFKRLRGSRAGFVLGQPVQPLENRLDVVLPKKFLQHSYCIALLSQGGMARTGKRANSLGRFFLTCLVARAMAERSSTMIFTSISDMGPVGGTLV